MSNSTRLSELLDRTDRTEKPRSEGITIALDTGSGTAAIADLAEVAGAHCDFAKIAWGSALITGNIEAKLDAYRRAKILPLLGGTLFEYCYMRDRTESLLAICREYKIHIEISDGVVDLPRAEKLRWIERFAAQGEVFSEVGGKIHSQALDWKRAVEEEISAGASKVVIEGREVGPVGKEIREDLVDLLVSSFGAKRLVFEALERYQQVWLIRKLGPNVNLGNIRLADVLTLESFRRGLKEHTLLHFGR
jgi:phosphosulfolactate synthase